jgi:hypothetical protein
MISGRANEQREAIIQLDILGENQQRQVIQAVIDTGYTVSNAALSHHFNPKPDVVHATVVH